MNWKECEYCNVQYDISFWAWCPIAQLDENAACEQAKRMRREEQEEKRAELEQIAP